MRRLLALLLPGIPLGLLLLPAASAWLDTVRELRGERFAFREAPRRVVVLGFDGVDPEILREYLESHPDALPHMRLLAEEGTFLACRTTNPPESPVAWATFATGLNPGGHGIFDFVHRDLDAEDTYRPVNGMVERRLPIVDALGIPLKPPRAVNKRGGEGFWEPVARAGYRVSILRMPLTFPATLERGGELISGLGVPDLRATNGSYTLFRAGADAWDGHTEFGGRHIKIYPRQGAASAELEGPPDPRAPLSGKRLTLPISFTFRGESATLSIADLPPIPLELGLHSPWVRVTFASGPLIRIEGLVRFLLLATGKEPAIYASPIQISPFAPIVPISAPPSFITSMAERLGAMRTAGWPEDTFAANDRVLNDAQVFEDIRDTYRADERLLLDRLQHSGASLLAMIFTATDRVSYLFFRYRDIQHPAHNPREIEIFRERTGIEDPVLESYRWMDATVGAAMARLGPRDILLVVSDHGFHTWRQGVNLNHWLWRENFLTLSPSAMAHGNRTLNDFFRGNVDTGEIDWSKTRAYALGLGQIYLNLKGRESAGVVEPADRDRLLEEISTRLLALKGPDGTQVFRAIYRGDEIWHGPRMRDAPDLQCAFAEGYRVSWQTALLGVPPELFETNTFPWSGDHCSNDVAETSGVFLSNRRMVEREEGVRGPGLEDMAPTICALFGVPPPAGAEGRVLPLGD